MPRLSIPLTAEQHTAIKVKAAQVGLSQAEVARRLLFAWLTGEMLTEDELQNCIIGIEYIKSEVNLDTDDHKELSSLIDKLYQMRAMDRKAGSDKR